MHELVNVFGSELSELFLSELFFKHNPKRKSPEHL